jgi:peroxiredoxin
MIRAFGLLSVAVAALVSIGCDQAKKTATTPAAPPSQLAGNVTEVAANVEKPKTEAEAKAPEVGGKGPAWENLAGTDDKKHSLADLKESKAVAIIFTCNTCPVAKAYEDRLIKLSNDYKDKGVAVVAINVNKDKSNDLDAMKRRAEEKSFPYAYLFDSTQQIARDYGATCTPHVFLLDQDRKVAYMGAIDDEMNADAVKHHHLQDAIDAVLAGKAPEVAKTKQTGCGIHYE